MEVFDYIELASEKYGYKSSSSISIALNHPSRVAGEYHFAYYSDELFDYLKEHHFEYLCDCYKQAKNCLYFVDLANKLFYKKSELAKKLYDENDFTTREIDEILKNDKFEINNVQYELLNSRRTQ